MGPHLYTVDNIIELHERLAYGDENPLTAFSIRGKSGVYDWHRRAAHRNMGTTVDIANGAVTGMVLKTYLKTCPGWTAARPALLQKRNALRSGQVAHARRRRWSSSTAIWSRWPWQVRICANGRLFACKFGAPFESQTRWASQIGSLGCEDGERNGSAAKAVMFDDVKELVAGRMREYCEHKGLRVNASVQCSPSSNRVAEHQQHARCCAIQASRRPSGQR